MKLHWLLLLCLAVVGCAPPYIEELDSAAAAVGQMAFLGTLGPLRNLNDDVTGTKFLPVKPSAATIDTLSIQSGFLVAERSGAEDLTFVFNAGGSLQTSSSYPFSLAGADPNYPLFEYDVTATGTTPPMANIVVLLLNGSSPNNTYQSFTANPVSGPMQSVSSPQFFTGLFGSGSVVAARDIPLLAAPIDQFTFFVNASGTHMEYTVGLSNGVFSGSSIMNSSVLPLPGAGNRVLYYWNGQAGALSLSYASYYSAGQWVCYQWNQSPTSQVLLANVTARIDASLTTGELLSTQGGTLRVYDSAGSAEASIPIGALQFCYEAYVGTTPYVFFSLSLKLSQGDWAFRVYAIPTTSLRSLRS
jgi:hypothetical protein